ncbi:MAG: hypothetical protein WCF78_02525 [archaeon]
MKKNTAKTIVKINSILNWISGIGFIFFGIFILLFDSKYIGNNLVTSITGVLLIIIGVLIILLGKGLWNLRNWARIISLILLSICFLFSLLLLIRVMGLSTAKNGLEQIIIPYWLVVSPILILIITGLFLYFLAFNETVIALFK